MSKYNVSNDEKKTTFEVKVLKAKVVKEGRVNFNILINGVYIYGMTLIEYKTTEGKEGTLIDFPSWKSETQTDENGKPKYNPYVTFPITKELKQDIENQIDIILNK